MIEQRSRLWQALQRQIALLPPDLLRLGERLRRPVVEQESPPPPEPEEPRRIGLVLGGGGGKGGAHLGVLAALEQLEVPIDLIAGTSIGGAVGVLYAAGLSVEEIGRAFTGFTLRRIATPDPSRTGLLGSRKREAFLRELLGDRTFADLRVPCAVTTVDLASGRVVVIDEGPLVPALMATTALPGIFPPVVRGDEVLCDGGTLNNLPIDVVERMGAGRVVAVQLVDSGEGWTLSFATPTGPLARLTVAPRQFELAQRAVAVMVAHATEMELRQHPPALLLKPDVGEIGILDMARPDAGLRAGASVALAAEEELCKLRAWRLAVELGVPDERELLSAPAAPTPPHAAAQAG
ncbi:MAG: hypothetical protein RLZZ387_2891 [Chloroflexota bacterium]